MLLEMQLLWFGVLGYVAAGILAIFALVLRKRPDRTVLALLLLGLGFHMAAIAIRWVRLGHGPFITMFEILSSNIWSLLLVFTVVYWRFRPIRPTAAIALPLMFVMMGWLLISDPDEGHLPATYDTIWLYVHIGFGKIFLGAMLVAIGLSAVVLLRRAGIGTARLANLPDDTSLAELAYRFMALALIFDTLMLVAGAIWAQDAWGRYWAWDPLETWSFTTWLLLGFALHLRVTFRPGPQVASAMAIAVFVLAFLTFFGVPFITEAPHKGAV